MVSENTRNIKIHSAQRTLKLPEEIVEEILSRLPVKSLLRFRCLSKSWRSLIGSKRFIKTQLQNSTNNTTFACHRIILNSNRSYRRMKQCSLHSLLNEIVPDMLAFDDPISIPFESICLVGCCTGLHFVRGKYFVLWNPSTRMSKKLPDIDDEMRHGRITKYGFGFDESNDDYKVFDVRYLAKRKVYSLKTNSWKTMKERDVYAFGKAGKFASGKLHWSRANDYTREIVSFDLKSEVYGIVEQPCYLEGDFGLTLGVIGGCLCVLCDYQKTHLDVWVLKQYGVKESWDKVATLPHFYGPWDPTPFAIGPNGEILLNHGPDFRNLLPERKCVSASPDN